MGFGTVHSWTALSATGQTASVDVPLNDVHTIQAIPSGSPSAATANLQGSLDGQNWFDISGDQDVHVAVMFHVVNRAVSWVRMNLSALSGGTAPTVAFSYGGHPTGGRI